MKIFVVGLPCSGRTTVSKSLSKNLGLTYIDSMSWIKSTFRDQELNKETNQQYEDSYIEYLINRLKLDPDLCSRNIQHLMRIDSTICRSEDFVIDNLLNPRDFVQLFDYNTDIVVFLNRIDNSVDYRNDQNIAISVMRDYCFWMASSKLISKDRWLEFNFAIPGDPNNDSIKKLGIHNTVILVKSVQRVISFLEEKLKHT